MKGTDPAESTSYATLQMKHITFEENQMYDQCDLQRISYLPNSLTNKEKPRYVTSPEENS